jgi:phosphoglycolate phosphatase
LNQAIIFDFDGTLIDSKKAIYQCFQNITNYLAPERISYAKNILIGPPLRDTASEILGPNHQGKLDEFVKLFIEVHDENAINNSHPYPGVVETLNKLKEKKVFMAIATNKRQAPIIKLINHYKWQDYFNFIECSDDKKPIRNKDEMIKDILNNDKKFNKAFFVGDTPNDGLSANKNNLLFIKANYGYGHTENWGGIKIFSEINDIQELMEIYS